MTWACTKDQMPQLIELDQELESLIKQTSKTGEMDFYVLPQENDFSEIPQDLVNNPLTAENSTLTISINKEITTVDILIYNMQGQRLSNETKNILPHLPYLDLNLGHLPQGMYYIQLIAEDWNTTQKVLIMK